MLIEHISVSRDKLWHTCEQNYKFQYHLKIPSLEKNPIHFEYGTIIHKIIEIHSKNKGNLDINSVAKEVMKDKVELPAEYKKKLPEHLRQYLRLCEKIGFEGFVEWDFKYDLDPPNGRFVVGFIDRIIQKNDNYFIIDWKTTKKGFWREDRNSIKKSLQLQVYARMLQKLLNINPKNIIAALYFLDGGDLIGAKFSEKTLDEVEKRLLETHKEIESSNPDLVLGTVGKHCKFCNYKKICSFYSLT
jgi:CRISPR/Cas system-associated exonuclease Cas4 (RecB family)